MTDDERKEAQSRLDRIESQAAQTLHNIGCNTTIVLDCQEQIEIGRKKVQALRQQAAEVRAELEKP